jgi:hypothetical protein
MEEGKMYPTELIYHALGKPEVENLEPHEGVCAICGKPITEGVKISKVVSGTFTNWNELAVPSSQYACKECALMFQGEYSKQLRRSSFVATAKEVIFFKNSDLAQYLFSPPQPPFVFAVTTSFKKHNAFRSFVSYSKDKFLIRYEDAVVIFDRLHALRVFRAMIKLYYGGFTKSEIELGNYSFKRMMDYGNECLQLEEELSIERGSPLFDLLITALPAQRRENFMKIQRGKKNERKTRKGGQASLLDLAAN